MFINRKIVSGVNILPNDIYNNMEECEKLYWMKEAKRTHSVIPFIWKSRREKIGSVESLIEKVDREW